MTKRNSICRSCTYNTSEGYTCRHGGPSPGMEWCSEYTIKRKKEVDA